MNQAEQKAMVEPDKTMQERRQMNATKGDGEASVVRVFDVRRFTRQEHERGMTAGWRLYGEWHRRMGGLVWAWFRREVDDGTT